ncbi:MAG: trypsin-like serine protease [Myxococcales bacterium]|nr:trypsin-like serine protease [Myxococcales bacterium]
MLFTAACLLAACDNQDEGPPPGALGEGAIGHSEQAIQGGYVDDFDTNVVGLVHLGNQSIGSCSGTLIAPNVVLTAQHCVANSSSGGGVQCGVTEFSAPYPVTSFYVTTNTSFSNNPADYRNVAEVHLPPSDGTAFCGFDQAIVVLDSLIPAEEATPSIPRVDTPLLNGEEYYAVGFGQTADNPNASSGTRYRRDQLFTACVGLDCGAANYISSTEFLGDTGVCSGDSGGPAFDLQNRVVGVASRGAPNCESPVYGHVQGWGEWIKEITIHAAALGGYEAPAWALGKPTDPVYDIPIGEACMVPEDCPWGCHGDGYCTRPCQELAPCPEGYTCNADAICELIPPPPEPTPKSDADGGGSTTTGCSLTGEPLSNADPTKPIPWKQIPIALGALALWVRRRRS